MSLEVTVLSASNLPDVDSKDKGVSDPFVELTFRGRKKKTPFKQDNLNPTWKSGEATFKWLLEDAPLTTEEKLSVEIKDKEDFWINRHLGQVEISLLEARRRGGIAVKKCYNLQDDKHHPIIDATVTLEVKYTPPRGKDKIHIHKAIEEESDADSDVDKNEQDYDEVDAAEEIGARKSRRWHYPKSKRRRVSRKWSTKTKDFQVLIRIIEGRCLPGKYIHPLVRVTVAGQRRETSVQPPTNSPFYNEDLQFYFPQTSETELFDKTILLEVFNARGLFRFNALLAVFKLDVGYVYERKDHSIIRKWIMMCKPEGKEDISLDGEISSTKTSARTPRSTAGYLKITAAVQAPGDKLPVGIDASSRDDKDDDIESNCLVPVGVQRQGRLLVLKVYQVNDLPQMDTGILMRYKSFFSKLFSRAKEKEEHTDEVVDGEGERALVDPYLTFSFGGKEVSTEIRYNSSDPKFKEDLRIPCMFPSMCERLKIQLMDWDQGPGNDDYIGTEFLSLSSISGPGAGLGEGFLPMFGPCFINFYGSPRENYQITDKYDYLNKGIGEGVAYRGRALVELTTLPLHGSLNQPDRKPFAKEDEKKFQPFQKLSNFTLFACFHEATMISLTDGPVEFELSIGNKGTKFDESVAHSNTSPCNAVFDGSHYKYMPWGPEKPCIWIDCQWEDISFRIETLNILNRMRETLENILESMKKLKDEKEEVTKSLRNFAETCKEKLTHFKNDIPSKSGERNSLDNEQHKLRLAELEELATELDVCKENVIAEIRRIKSMALEVKIEENMLESMKKLKGEKEEVTKSLRNFAETCTETRTHFKNDIPGKRNSLDDEVHKLRLAELKELAKDATELVNADADVCKENVIAIIKVYIRRIKSIAVEAQLSMPDVVLWMISGNTRIAYERIPAHDVMYLKSKNNDACGKFCGKVIDLSLKYPPVMKEEDDRFEIPTLVRLEIWLGLAKYQQQWFNRKTGTFKVFAERFENEVKKEKQWVESKSRNWPHYSDVTGNFELPNESFTEPDGWSFTDDTWIEPSKEITTIHYPEESLTEYSDQVYEHETRKYPGGEWEEGKPKYVDLDGNETSLSSGPPTGWAVVSTKLEADQKRQYPVGWTIDCNDRAVDYEGWEYSQQRTYLDYGPEEKAYHLSRRRLLVRRRSRVRGKQVLRDPTLSDGWEYARSLHAGFHPAEKSNDRIRRKRLLREIYNKKKDGSIKYPIFKVTLSVKGKQEEKQSALCILPRMFVTYEEPIKCELWVSIYRARGLLAQDDTGMNDPYVRVAFLHQSKTTKTVEQTLCPTWDQTLIFEEIIYGELLNNPPTVVMELFDRDKRTDDFLGRCILTPKVMSGEDSKSKLRWRKVRRGEQDGGQILSECELFLQLKDGTATPPVRPKEQDGCFLVRDDLKPKTKQKTLEILCWGLRDIKSKKPLRLLKPSVEFECNQETLLSTEISDMRNCPNFSSPILIRKKLEFPSEKLDTFSPSLNIRVFDKTMFGKSLIGVHEIKSLVPCNSEEGKHEDHTGDIRQETEGGAKGKGPAGTRREEQESEDHELFDWWSKYYASKELAATKESEEEASSSHESEQLTKHTLTIFPSALEDVPQFRGFNDFVSTFTLHKGKTKSAKDEDDTIVGQFKGTFRIFNDPDSNQQSLSKLHLPSRKPVDCVVRVYVVRGIQLQAKDRDGLADPYLIVSLGKKSQGKPSEHKAKTLNPEFGRVFEFRAKIPLVKNLKIQVMDYDFPDPDDLIGETEIDLEQRLLSRYHATCGLPKTYFKSGPFQWRDTLTPFQLLAKHCIRTGQKMRLDKGTPEIIHIGEDSYPLEDSGTEEPSNPETGERLQRLALQILNSFKLVPEHVETRPLFSKVRPDIEQGKLEMWVDIFSEEDEEVLSYAENLITGRKKRDPSSSDINQVDGTKGETKNESAEECSVDKLLKASVCIDPREPVKYELRVIIWNTIDVELDDKSIFGEEMSDIFVKAWLVDKDEQNTDVHERSLDGSGSFNWRMIFPFEYDPFEKKIVIKEKVHFLGSDVKEVKKPPVLKVQIFDKDRLSGSDFLGGLELTLNELIRPCVHPSRCGTKKDPEKILDKKCKIIDLFSTGSKRGWWACYACCDGEKVMKGKVEMTLDILKDEEAKAKPAGRGQSSPNQYPTLDKPDRPAHSFLWYTSPFKTFKFIFWRNINKCYLLKILFCIFLALLIFLFVYSIPNYAAKKMVGA